MAWLPTMIEHRCGIGERGGFFERLRRGTYLAHILEHVTLELQTPGRHPTSASAALARRRKRAFTRSPSNTRKKSSAGPAWRPAAELLTAAVHDLPFDVAGRSRQAARSAPAGLPGPQHRGDRAGRRQARGIPVRRLNSGSLVQLGYGAQQRRILAAADRSHRRHRRGDRPGQRADPLRCCGRWACRCPKAGR